MNVSRHVRVVLGLSAVLALLLLRVSPATASCAPPASVFENAERAVAVLYGSVTGQGQGSVTVRVDLALKSSVTSPVIFFMGPGRTDTGGAVFTSVDYEAKLGSDHVFYLIRGADGQLETNACIGSHAGRPTPAESAYFAPAASPEASAPDPAGQREPAQASATPVATGAPATATPSPALLGMLGLAVLGALAIAGALGRRLVTRTFEEILSRR